MDNPNDFIHIDEVFRKLNNKEEPEGNGSWMRMKELLDKEMSVGSVASPVNSLRRYLIPMVATLLIGSGLAYYGIQRNNGAQIPQQENAGIVASANSDAKTNAPSGTNSTNHPSNPGKAPVENLLVNSTAIVKDKAGIKEHSDKNKKDLSKAIHKFDANHSSNSNHKTITDNESSTINNTEEPNHNVIAGSNERNLPKAVLTGENNTNPGKSIAGATNGKMPVVTPPAKPFEKQNVIETLYPAGNTAKTPSATNSGNNKSATQPENENADMKVVAARFNKEKIVKDENGVLFKEVRDTVKKIDMVQRAEIKDTRNNRTTEIVIDTLAITRVERIRYTPLAPMEIASLRKANIIPQAEAIVPMARLKTVTVSNETVNMVPLSDYKVASRKVDPSKFNQLVQSTSQGISNYFDGTNKFYAAILLGGNGFVGNPSAFGMQVGIAGLYQLNERLTLMAELKYANHYFSNYSINDQSVNYENVSSQQSGLEWLFSGMQNTTKSAYKINSFSALEFPVTVNYSLGRIGVFGGLNMAYAFPMKWDKTNVVNSSTVSQSTSQNTNPFLNSDFKLNEQKDFASRFGMGYVAGITYDISRKLSFDGRISQNMWTNYNGDADAVNKLFKMPTFQFSIGYFFGRRERVAYILDK